MPAAARSIAAAAFAIVSTLLLGGCKSAVQQTYVYPATSIPPASTATADSTLNRIRAICEAEGMSAGLLTEANRDAGYVAVYRLYYRDQIGTWQTLAVEVRLDRDRRQYELQLGESYEEESPRFRHLRDALRDGLGADFTPAMTK